MDDLGTALTEELEQNVHTVAAATEDLHHQNLARMAIMKDNGDVVSEVEILNIKIELLLEALCEGDPLRKAMVGFRFQQRLSESLTPEE